MAPTRLLNVTSLFAKMLPSFQPHLRLLAPSPQMRLRGAEQWLGLAPEPAVLCCVLFSLSTVAGQPQKGQLWQ
jgi:hypothetical protein